MPRLNGPATQKKRISVRYNRSDNNLWVYIINETTCVTYRAGKIVTIRNAVTETTWCGQAGFGATTFFVFISHNALTHLIRLRIDQNGATF